MSSFTMVLYVNGAVPTMNIAKAKPGIPEVIQRVRAQAVERIITLTRGVRLLMTLWLSEILPLKCNPVQNHIRHERQNPNLLFLHRVCQSGKRSLFRSDRRTTRPWDVIQTAPKRQVGLEI